MLTALAAYRFLLGIGIGGEYPAGSVGCSESTGELESGTRNRWFIWFTNLAIDAGFVVAAFVPMVVVSDSVLLQCLVLANFVYRFLPLAITICAPPGVSC
jgi:MFS family permease